MVHVTAFLARQGETFAILLGGLLFVGLLAHGAIPE
jgi:hypothetical protein